MKIGDHLALDVLGTPFAVSYVESLENGKTVVFASVDGEGGFIPVPNELLFMPPWKVQCLGDCAPALRSDWLRVRAKFMRDLTLE